MKLLIDPEKTFFSNCLFVVLYLKVKAPKGKIHTKDLHYQRLVYKALSKNKEPVHVLTKHYFISIPNENGEEDYVYEFNSIKNRILFPVFFKGKVSIRYKEDAVNRYLYTLLWAMKELEYEWKDIEKELLEYENRWKCKSALCTLLFRGIEKDALDDYRLIYPNLLKDLDELEVRILVKEES